MENKKEFIIIIVLVSIVLVLGGYIAIDKFVLNKDKSATLTTINDVDIDLNSFYKIADTLNKFDNAFNDVDSKYLGYPYVNGKLKVEKFDSDAALFVSLYDELIPSNTQQTLPAAIVKSNFQKIFGKDLTYSASNIDGGEKYKITYNKTANTYTYTLPTKSGGYTSGYVTKNIKTVLQEDKVIVTRKVFFVEYGIDPTTGALASAVIYKNANKTNRLGEVSFKNGVISENEVIAKYSSRLNTYEYTFKHLKDDDYSLYLIEKIK